MSEYAEEVVAVLLLVALVPLLWWLMLRGWRSRARRQGELTAPPAPPADRGAQVLPDVEGSYVTTTLGGASLERVVPHGLGVPSQVVAHVSTAGVLLERRGAPDLWLPADALTGVRLQRGIIGKTVDAEGLVVLSWQHDGTSLDTGLRVRHEAERQPFVDAVTALAGAGGGSAEEAR